MAKRKKKKGMKPRTGFILFAAYMVIGMAVAALFLNDYAPQSGSDPATSPWALYPMIAMLWPIFLVIWLVRFFF